MSAEMDGEAEYRFDAVLRNLMTCGMVVRTPNVEQKSWQLTRQAQRRLEMLACPDLPPEQLIYFGHRCANCHTHAATRYRDGAFLCFSCVEDASVTDPTPIVPDTVPHLSQRPPALESELGDHARSA